MGQLYHLMTLQMQSNHGMCSVHTVPFYSVLLFSLYTGLLNTVLFYVCEQFKHFKVLQASVCNVYDLPFCCLHQVFMLHMSLIILMKFESLCNVSFRITRHCSYFISDDKCCPIYLFICLFIHLLFFIHFHCIGQRINLSYLGCLISA